MIKNKKRRFIFILVAIVILIITMMSTFAVYAGWFDKEKIPIPTVRKDVYVYDEDDIIDDNIETEINTLLIQLENKTGAEVAVVTVTSLLDMEIEDYSYKLANTLGIGKADEDNGVLLLISKSDTRVRLEIGRGLEGCLNDSKCGRILDDYFVPYREKDEYSEGTRLTIEAVVSVIAKEYDVTIDDVDSSLAEGIEAKEAEAAKQTQRTFIIMLIIILIVIFCDFTFLDGAILNALFSGSSSSGGSSRGGFGGGSFGGGGASR